MIKKIKTLIRFVIIIFIVDLLLINAEIGFSDSGFVNCFWNTTGYNDGYALNDWREAGSVDYVLGNFSGTIYVKNDYNYLYMGILIIGSTEEKLIWRINFDTDSDGLWAEDSKELSLSFQGIIPKLEIEDKFYLKGDPTAYNDPVSDDFYAKVRKFTMLGEKYLIFELKIPLVSNDPHHDLQVQNPEVTIVSFSMDVFYADYNQNATWKGGSYPNYANASNYLGIVFAGPQDIRIPEFEEQLPPTSTTESPPETATSAGLTPEDEGTSPKYASSSPAFEGWLGLVVLISAGLITIKRRNKKGSSK